jgi:hypothetical protein
MEWPWSKKKPEQVRPPKVGGTRVPDQVLRIDFSKPHDFHFRFYNGGAEVLRSCVLIGFTTPMDSDGNRVGGGGEWGHDRWLVLRLPDGRLVHAPRDGLQYIVESLPAGEGGQAQPAAG